MTTFKSMLTFFRRIRKGLLGPGHTRKYFLYAIGEILLVMIGILLALQVNNWNEERQDRKLEKEYLVRLIHDLDLDMEDLKSCFESAIVNLVLCEDALVKLGADTSILWRGRPYQVARDLVIFQDGKVFVKDSVLQSQPQPLETFGHQLTQISNTRKFDLTMSTFNDMMSTGKIEVISNRELRNHIQDYYSQMISGLDFENGHFYYERRLGYYLDILFDIGVPPGSNLTVDDIKAMTESDHRLVTAVYHLYASNRTFIQLVYAGENSRWNLISNMRAEIEKELESL